MSHLVNEHAEDLHFDTRLAVEALLVANHLDGAHHLELVVKAGEDLPEGPLPQDAHNLVTIRDVVVLGGQVVPSLVVIAVVVGGCSKLSHHQAQSCWSCSQRTLAA